MLGIYRAGEIDLFENLDIVHTRLLVAWTDPPGVRLWRLKTYRRRIIARGSYRGYSELRTRTVQGSYNRAMHSSIGP